VSDVGDLLELLHGAGATPYASHAGDSVIGPTNRPERV
jgi:hypothetical protein